MIVAGLTGSIAMGKSTVAGMFAELGAPIFDADDAVRTSTPERARKRSRPPFRAFSSRARSIVSALVAVVLGDKEALQRLEGLVHPAVADARARFLERAEAAGRRLAVVDVPLLFETGGEASVDLVIVVSAPASVQRARALSRAGMTDAKLEAILSRQMTDAEKRRRAHFVIDTRGQARVDARASFAQFMRAAAAMAGARSGHA